MWAMQISVMLVVVRPPWRDFGIVCGSADVGPVLQGLIRHFRPEMEERIGAFSERIKIAA